MTTAVDPDDLSTWPTALLAELSDALTKFPTTEYASDLAIPLSNERLVMLLEGRPLRAYHATRLLEHEVIGIRRDGLRMLTPEHVERRISAAVAAGSITKHDAAMFRAGTVYAIPGPGERDGRVCAVVSRSTFADFPSGVRPLLSTWGGEAIYWRAAPEARVRLAELGRPSIVVVDLPLLGVSFHAFPGLGPVFAGHLAGLAMAWGDVHYFADVPGSAVADIWQPGSSTYDRYPMLPR
ncbi:MAG: hypothetical protein IT193_16715 [Propionibacteriaceae bacterium]|nr:hypothetical protein [Propionibacteriaceae bacterium]